MSSVRVLRLLLIAVAVLGLTAAPVWAARASGKLSYLSYGKQIRVMNADGSRDRALARVKTPDFYSSWSPDGRRLAYIAQLSGVRAVSFPSGRSRLVWREVPSPLHVAWSPDGQKLALVQADGSTSGQPPAVLVMNADGTSARAVNAGVFGEGGWISDLMWSADSTRVAFRRIDQTLDLSREDQVSIWAAPISGEAPVKLFDTGAASEAFAWAPDGRRFAFERGYRLYVVGADGTGERAVRAPFGGGAPTWSPDGRWLAFAGGAAGRPTNIYRVRPDGTGFKQLTHADQAQSPAWTVGRVTR